MARGAFAAGLAFLIVVSGAGASAAANPTKLSINCVPTVLTLGAVSTCTATVTDSGPVDSRRPPAGNVTFTVNGAGTLDPPDGCALGSSGAFSSKCTVTYTPTEISGGTHELSGTYEGDDGHGRATSQLPLYVTPANDELDNAAPIGVPAKMTGTTEGATWSWEDDPELCSDAYAPVWYLLSPSHAARVAVRMTVRGRVDSVVAVFREDRSKLKEVDHGCALTDESGVAGVSFDAERGAKYLVAVAAPWDARVGGFTLETAVVPPVAFPGTRLGRDADVRLDPLLRPGVAFSVALHEGVTYRIGASAGSGCVHVSLLHSGARAADASLRKSDGCSGYLVYTPGLGDGHDFPLVVTDPSGPPLHVHVAVRQAEGDDLAPGVPLLNGQVRHARLTAREADVVDVYRFELAKRGDATLSLAGAAPADLLLLTEGGAKVACACDGAKRADAVASLSPGTYYAVVRGRPGATGAYGLTLRVRTPTGTSVKLARSGSTLTMSASLSPATVTGRVVFELERFDPLAGWQFARAIDRRLAGGKADATTRLAQGRWRVRVHYIQTLSWSASASGWAEVSAPSQ